MSLTEAKALVKLAAMPELLAELALPLKLLARTGLIDGDIIGVLIAMACSFLSTNWIQ
jgi:hypothetical protein